MDVTKKTVRLRAIINEITEAPNRMTVTKEITQPSNVLITRLVMSFTVVVKSGSLTMMTVINAHTGLSIERAGSANQQLIQARVISME